MELKHDLERLKLELENVLIVPSGIETFMTTLFDLHCKVLIVPSGIETSIFVGEVEPVSTVLIVPSGIETELYNLHQLLYIVLIVPSGIETCISSPYREITSLY